MATRPGKAITIRPAGLSDAVDGSNAFSGAMTSLQNLIPNPTTKNQYIPRPAAISVANFLPFTTPAQGEALTVIGTLAYGFIASARYSGKSEPFCYDLVNGDFITLSNVTAANCPTTAPTTGDWVPPEVVGVTSTKIIFTHPGYDGVNYMIGWIDLSGADITFIKGNLVNGSNVISSLYDGSTSDPMIDGVQVGYLIAGTGIPANTYVTDMSAGTFDLSTTGNITIGNSTISGIPSTVGVAPGMGVAGVGFTAGTFVETVPAGNTTVTISSPAIANATATPVTFSGGGNITMSNNATASGNLTALTFTGGNATAPLYGAGNTAPYPLVARPTCVSAFNGRAYYGVLNGVAWSDSELPLQISNADQALFLGDKTPVTAMGGVPLTNQLTGGIVQALIVFKGGGPYWQITGDQTTTLQASETSGSMGTLAPNTVCPSPLGLIYMAPDGMRIIQPTGISTDPIGINGSGVNIPFVQAINPTRMCAAYNHSVVRISVQNGSISSQPFQEYWFDTNLKTWSGPHTFPAAAIAPYDGTVDTFLMFAQGVNANLWQSDPTPNVDSVYTENGVALTNTFQPALSPDNSDGVMNALVESMLGFALPAAQRLTISVSNEQGVALDTLNINGSGSAGSIWDSFDWGAAAWGASIPAYQQYFLPWHIPLVFKQASWMVAGASIAGYVVGNLNFKIQELEYPIQ